MAHCIDFPGANFSFGPPPGQEDSVGTMRCLSDGVNNTSCWKLTEDELEEVNRTGCIFLNVLSGRAMFPVFVGSAARVNMMIADRGGHVQAPAND